MKVETTTYVSHWIKARAGFGEFFARIEGKNITFGRATSGNNPMITVNHREARQLIHMLLKARKLADASRPD